MNNDAKFIYKRIGAYIIDVVLLSLLGTFLSGLPFLNPSYEESKELSKKYVDLFGDSLSVTRDIDKYREDETISIEELDELKKYENLLPVFEKYEEEIKGKDEINKLLDEVNTYYSDSFNKDARKIKRLDLYRDIIQLVLIVLLLVIVPTYSKGVTVGKALFKLRVVKEDDKDATIVNHLIRAVILYGVVFSIISMIFAQTLSVNDFYQYDNVVAKISNAVLLTTLGFMVFRQDCRSLHDLIAGTKVISTKEAKEDVVIVKAEEEIPEAKVESVKKSTKKKKTTKKK